jgi:DNA-binding NtrC family response regulator
MLPETEGVSPPDSGFSNYDYNLPNQPFNPSTIQRGLYLMSTRVLLVDDEKDFLDIMAERMGARGMEVSTATSAEDALKMVLKESYDAVIMDLMMPEMDGFKALKLFKETRPDMSIILLTANVPEEKCIEAIKLGAMDVIEKPADLNLLTQKIEEAKARKQD